MWYSCRHLSSSVMNQFPLLKPISFSWQNLQRVFAQVYPPPLFFLFFARYPTFPSQTYFYSLQKESRTEHWRGKRPWNVWNANVSSWIRAWPASQLTPSFCLQLIIANFLSTNISSISIDLLITLPMAGAFEGELHFFASCIGKMLIEPFQSCLQAWIVCFPSAYFCVNEFPVFKLLSLWHLKQIPKDAGVMRFLNATPQKSETAFLWKRQKQFEGTILF